MVFEPLGRPAPRQLIYRIRYPRPEVNKKRHLITLLLVNLHSKYSILHTCAVDTPNPIFSKTNPVGLSETCQ